ncbi:MAG TPA: hypothetical protein PLS50_00270 [Candidatus Dojkabacteria bacterium]|nr:hypothetical protein [Candidatus Dojkabacteria bacterium]
MGFYVSNKAYSRKGLTMTNQEIKNIRNELINEMREKINEQKTRKENSKDNSKFILAGMTVSQLNQVNDFLVSYKVI